MIAMTTLRILACSFLLAAAAGVNGADAPPARASALPDFTSLMKKQGPAVVNVITSRKPSASPQASAGAGRPRNGPGAGEGGKDDPMAEFFRRFMDPQEREPRQGLASGFIISA